MASRSLGDLTPKLRDIAQVFLDKCKASGLDVLIYCTLRSDAEQAALYAQGRTLPGRIVTNAKPGQSKHNPGPDGKARAFDAVPLVAGVAMWGDAKRLELMGQCGEACGLVWAGRWTGALRETVHFELKGA